MDSKISARISSSAKKPAFIPFVVAGYPNLETTKKILKCLDENNAACIELGLPFSDPLADGPIIQQAAKHALDNGVNTDKVFELLNNLKDSIKAPIIIFTYYNLILNYGIENFVKTAKDANVAGFIVPDLPIEESNDFSHFCKEHMLDHILLIAPTSKEERINELAKKSAGFIYLVSSTGVTGVRDSFSGMLSDIAAKIKSTTDTPIAVGFGVSKPQHIKELNSLGINGAIVGSALIKIIHDNIANEQEILNQLRAYIQELYSEV